MPDVLRVRLRVAGDQEHGRVHVAALVEDAQIELEVGPVVGQRLKDLVERLGQLHPNSCW